MTGGRVLFGVAGWAYADWKGVVYSADCPDTLRAVAQRVDLIEINTTFYGMPSEKNSRSWVERTADLGTFFTAKVPRDFTHERRLDADLLGRASAGYRPLAESQRLVGLLAQFDHTFRFAPEAVHHVARLAEGFAGTAPLFVEVRHRSWNEEAALAAMRALGVGVLELDYPGSNSGFARDVTGAFAGSGVAYFRLHGRNRAWFRRGAGRDEVYDWHYAADEVADVWRRLQRIRQGAATTIVVANNHFRGRALQLVEDLLAWHRAEG